jgi:hypothetical protein
MIYKPGSTKRDRNLERLRKELEKTRRKEQALMYVKVAFAPFGYRVVEMVLMEYMRCGRLNNILRELNLAQPRDIQSQIDILSDYLQRVGPRVLVEKMKSDKEKEKEEESKQEQEKKPSDNDKDVSSTGKGKESSPDK